MPFLIMLISSCVVIEPIVLSRALFGPTDAIAGRDTGGTVAAMQGEPCRKGERFQADESRVDAGAAGVPPRKKLPGRPKGQSPLLRAPLPPLGGAKAALGAVPMNDAQEQ